MIDKKEAIRQYKNNLPAMGVYCVTNLASKKILIGSSKNVNGILNRITFQLNRGSYVNEELQKDFTLQGETNFSFKIIDYLKPVEEKDYDYTKDLQVLEDMWIEKLQLYGDVGYNIKKTRNF